MHTDNISPGALLSWPSLKNLLPEQKFIARELWFNVNFCGVFNAENDLKVLAFSLGFEYLTFKKALVDLSEVEPLYIYLDEKTEEFFIKRFFEFNKVKKGWFAENCLNFAEKIHSPIIKRHFSKKINDLRTQSPFLFPYLSPSPSQAEEKSSDFELGVDFIKFGLEEHEIRDIYLMIKNKGDLQKAVSCFASLRKDSAVKNLIGCFKKRCIDSNFDDAGLLLNSLKKSENEAAVKSSIQKNLPLIDPTFGKIGKNFFPRKFSGELQK